MDELNIFVDRLIEEKGLDDLESDILDEIKADLHARVEDRINALILEKLPPESLGAFEKLLDAGDSEGMQKMCKEKIPHLEKVIAEELVSFRTIYLA